jgi:Lon-like ATP-dependent protease
MIANKYYKDMDIYTVENFRDVIEYAFVDCSKKTELMAKLLPLTDKGISHAKKIEAPAEMRPVTKQEDRPDQAKADPVPEEYKEPAPVKKKKSSKDSVPAPQ